jgi:hypothetical protein
VDQENILGAYSLGKVYSKLAGKFGVSQKCFLFKLNLVSLKITCGMHRMTGRIQKSDLRRLPHAACGVIVSVASAKFIPNKVLLVENDDSFAC